VVATSDMMPVLLSLSLSLVIQKDDKHFEISVRYSRSMEPFSSRIILRVGY